MDLMLRQLTVPKCTQMLGLCKYTELSRDEKQKKRKQVPNLKLE